MCSLGVTNVCLWFYVSDKRRVQGCHHYASTVKVYITNRPKLCKSAQGVWEAFGAAGQKAQRHGCHDDGKNFITYYKLHKYCIRSEDWQCSICCHSLGWYRCWQRGHHKSPLHLSQRGSWVSGAGVHGECALWVLPHFLCHIWKKKTCFKRKNSPNEVAF